MREGQTQLERRTAPKTGAVKPSTRALRDRRLEEAVDVSRERLIPESRDRFPESIGARIEEWAAISKWLPQEREYGVEDARRARKGAELVARMAETMIPWPER